MTVSSVALLSAADLEAAARHLRAADRAFTTEERNEHLASAQATLARASVVRPDPGRLLPPADDGADHDHDLDPDPLARAQADLAGDPGPLVDPFDPGTPLLDSRTDLPADGDGESDLERLAQAQADLAGDPDPYGEVPDPGDFGLPVAGGPAATAAGSLSDDAYMDQPDVGSTSTNDEIDTTREDP